MEREIELQGVEPGQQCMWVGIGVNGVEAEAAPEEPKLGEPCRSCTGHIRENNPMRCAECSPTAHQNYERSLWQDATCPTCNGSGEHTQANSGWKCSDCNGTGKKEKTDDQEN